MIKELVLLGTLFTELILPEFTLAQVLTTPMTQSQWRAVQTLNHQIGTPTFGWSRGPKNGILKRLESLFAAPTETNNKKSRDPFLFIETDKLYFKPQGSTETVDPSELMAALTMRIYNDLNLSSLDGLTVNDEDSFESLQNPIAIGHGLSHDLGYTLNIRQLLPGAIRRFLPKSGALEGIPIQLFRNFLRSETQLFVTGYSAIDEIEEGVNNFHARILLVIKFEQDSGHFSAQAFNEIYLDVQETSFAGNMFAILHLMRPTIKGALIPTMEASIKKLFDPELFVERKRPYQSHY